MKDIIILIMFCVLLSCNENEKIRCFNNFEEGKLKAKEMNKNLLVIFDLYGSSTNYVGKLLEDKEVKTILKSFIVVRLMCDDRQMKDSTQTIGNYNSNFQRKLMNEYYQPMFCVFSTSGNRIMEPLGYSKKEVVINYLAKGVPPQK